MQDEVAVTLGLALRISVGFVAGQLLDVLGIVVPDEGTKASLIGGLTGISLSELDAFRVLSLLFGAAFPGIENVESSIIVLSNDETGVQVIFAKLVLVVFLRRVGGESKRVLLWGELPVVHQPLEGQIEMVENGVGVDENASLVVSENLRHDWGLLPRITAILKFLDIDVVVFVTVDFGYEVSVPGLSNEKLTYNKPSG